MEVDTSVTEILQEAGEGQEIILEIDKSGDVDCEDGEIEEIVEIIEEIEEVEETEVSEEVEEVEQVVEHDGQEQIFEATNNAFIEDENYTDKVNSNKAILHHKNCFKSLTKKFFKSFT